MPPLRRGSQENLYAASEARLSGETVYQIFPRCQNDEENLSGFEIRVNQRPGGFSVDRITVSGHGLTTALCLEEVDHELDFALG